MRTTNRIRTLLAVTMPWLVAACVSNPDPQPIPARVDESTPTTPEQRAGYRVAVRFEGVEGLSERRLRRTIEDYMITLGREPERAALGIDAEFDLEDLYRQAGYPDIRVDHRFTRDDEKKTIDALFLVQEGPEVTVGVDLNGNQAFDYDTLIELWVRSASGTLGLGDPLFVESDILSFRRSLEVYYITHGYRDVLVRDPRIEREPGGDRAEVVIEIVEGPASLVRELRFDETLTRVLGEDEVADIRGRTEKQLASVRVLEAARQRAIARMLEIGYPTPSVILAPKTAPDDVLAVVVDITGEPGRRGRIDEVVVRGNEATAEWFIASHFEFDLGEYYDGEAIDLTRRSLYLSGLFTKVSIEPEWVDDESESLRLVIEVEEDDSRTVDVLAGYGSYERVRGMVRFEENNVFGTGRRFSIEGRASMRGYRGVATITDPRLFGTRTTLTIGGDVFRREEPSFTDRARGVTIALSRDLGFGVKARTGYTFRQRDDANTNLGTALDNYTQGNVFAELRIDRRDSVLYPRTGYLASLQFDTDDESFGSDVEFERVRFSASGHVPVYRKLNLALRASTGVLWPGETSDRIPLQERFFNGGENTVRSFRESRLGPLDADGSPVGGEFRNLFSAELRLPLRGLFEAAVFADAGNVGSSVDAYGLNDLRYAIGAGLRFNLPIGPIRLDAAHNPDRNPGEDEWVIHLSVGYPF